MSKTKHLPLRVAPMTPSRIDTAADRCITVAWTARGEGIENPYAEAEEFAAFIVRAVNAHDEMVAALERIAPLWHHMIGLSSPQEWHEANAAIHAALAKARGEV